MKPTRKTAHALALCLSAVFLATPSWAEKADFAGGGKDKGEKHEKQGKKDKGGKHDGGGHAEQEGGKGQPRVGAVFSSRDRDEARRYYAQETRGGKGCPPGLAKKNNGCMPPGQAKFRAGQALPTNVVYYPVPSSLTVRLPAVPSGHQYVRIGVDIVLLAPSRLVIDVMPGILVF